MKGEGTKHILFGTPSDFHAMCSGDIKAFERLFVSMYPSVCNIANYYLKNEMQSKDIAQEAFIKWWDKRNDFKDFAAVKSFLYVTVRNQSLNYLRDHRKEVDISGVLTEEDDDFDLMVIKGYKNPEIADQLGISVNSVKTLKYNALNVLRKELNGFGLVLLAWLVF